MGSSYAALLGAPTARRAGRSRYEATVGAGLPIIDTFHKLVETGDRVLRIEGCVSGTLMYVVSAVSAGTPFSEAVREAVERGYAEPDPREDLSGPDAARKALILARLLGYRGAAPTPDRPGARARCRKFSIDQFMTRAAVARRGVGGARQRAKRRAGACCATSSRPRRGRSRRSSTARAGVEPDRRAQGTRNLVAFTTRRYRDRAARRQRSRRRRGSHRRRHPERHLFARRR